MKEKVLGRKSDSAGELPQVPQTGNYTRAGLIEQGAQKLLAAHKTSMLTRKPAADSATASPVPHTDAVFSAVTPDIPDYTGQHSSTSTSAELHTAHCEKKHAIGNRPAAIHIDNISFQFESMSIFESFSLDVQPAQIRYILGRSGRGKTTLLFLIAGLLQPQRGTIQLSPPEAKIGFAYQDIRLIPHLTAIENILYVLPPEYGKDKAQLIAQQYLQAFGLQEFEHFLPAELSGGMQRRVSLARALAYPAEILLLDEAFDSLDPETKKSAVEVFSRIVQRQQRTVLCVTHDPIFTQLLEDIPSTAAIRMS